MPALPVSPLNQQPGRTKLALVGASQLEDEPPPLDDPTWEVWGCNSLWKKHLDRNGLFRADAWWEMHPLAVQTPQELLDMGQCPVPLYVIGEKGLQYKHWIQYPLANIRHEFHNRDYYTNTFAYQIALALTLCFTEIGLWGVELWQGSTRETRVELPCLTYWLGVAKGRGVTITLPRYSKLLWHEHLYGYDYEADVAQSKSDDAYVAVRWYEEEQARQQKQVHR